jgi:hypothetical protein
MDEEDRKQAAIVAVERVMAEFVDVFACDADLPVLVDWCLVVAHDSAVDPSSGSVYRLNKCYQSTYRSAGLLQMAIDDYRGVSVPEN